MDLNQIRYFLAVAESQHMTISAEKLHVSQPSLTKSIHKLQEELEVPLFESKGRNIALTPYGRYLQERLQPIMAEIEALPSAVRRMAKLENETIHVNVLSASSIVSGAVIEYKRNHPEVNFHLIQSKKEDNYDIQISSARNREKDSGTEHSAIFNEQIYLAVPMQHPLAEKDSILLQEISEEPFISLVGSKQLTEIGNELCAAAGFTPNIVFESDAPQMVRNMIEANLGVGFWPKLTWRNVERRHLKLLEIEDAVCQRQVVLKWKENKADCSAVREFFEYLVDYFENAKE